MKFIFFTHLAKIHLINDSVDTDYKSAPEGDVVPDALDQIMKYKENEDKFIITKEGIKDLIPNEGIVIS